LGNFKGRLWRQMDLGHLNNAILGQREAIQSLTPTIFFPSRSHPSQLIRVVNIVHNQVFLLERHVC
jgi:hypothetical protein